MALALGRDVARCRVRESAAGATDSPSIAAKLREVANPPGKIVCPGQWRKAFR